MADGDNDEIIGFVQQIHFDDGYFAEVASCESVVNESNDPEAGCPGRFGHDQSVAPRTVYDQTVDVDAPDDMTAKILESAALMQTSRDLTAAQTF